MKAEIFSTYQVHELTNLVLKGYRNLQIYELVKDKYYQDKNQILGKIGYIRKMLDETLTDQEKYEYEMNVLNVENDTLRDKLQSTQIKLNKQINRNDELLKENESLKKVLSDLQRSGAPMDDSKRVYIYLVQEEKSRHLKGGYFYENDAAEKADYDTGITGYSHNVIKVLMRHGNN